ncbi:MAG: hypothetical protein HKN05_21605 [Rhizobiales bacterium]|nr:hypothetical protein [Hyphomicrobiales bacterium]
MRITAISAVFLALSLGPVAAETAKEQYDYLQAKCGPTLQMSASECECIVSMAKADLSKRELDMAVMFVKQDQAGIAKVQSEITGQQLKNAMAFVSQAPTKCKNK